MWFIRSALSAIYPREGALPGVAECDLSAFLLRFRRETSRLMWFGVVLSTFVYHLTPLVTVLVPLPAFLLPAALADRHAARITTSRIYLLRQTTFILKLVAGLCWGADDRVRASMGLPVYPKDPGTWRQA